MMALTGLGLGLWGVIAADIMVKILRKGKALPTWPADGDPIAPAKPPDAILSKYAIGVLVWGTFLALAVATLFSIWHLFWPGPFWHRVLFWSLVTFPFSLWAGYYIIRSTRERQS
jgi:hypothetical protein